MDLVQEDQREVIFSEREEDLKKLSKPLDCTCFRRKVTLPLLQAPGRHLDCA